MKLRGIDFGTILGASGVQGFFGEGYWFHRYFRPFGLNFKGCTFTAKTTTLTARRGNMPTKKDGITPKKRFPKCIVVKFGQGVMLNAVGLSGPGAKALFEMNRWQKRTEPFFISFMSTAGSAEERLAELKEFVRILLWRLPYFSASVGLQINFSCPNTGLDPDELVHEAEISLNAAAELDIPLMPKFSILIAPRVVKKIAENPNCNAICVSNTIPWGKLPERIDWKELFGSDVSPLAKFGGGGLSGWPLLLLVAEWVREAREIGMIKPIVAGGGVLRPTDVNMLKWSGASSVSVGSVATLRPWRVDRIIKRAHQLFR